MRNVSDITSRKNQNTLFSNNTEKCNSTGEFTDDNRSVLLTHYCAGGKIETNEMGRACSAYGGG